MAAALPSFRASAPAPVPSGLVSTSASAAASSSIVVPHRPVTAFTGLARPSTASVQQARQASIQRNLHGSAAGSSSLATSSNSPTSPKKKRKSGPPRSYTETSASIPALNDFAAVTAPTSAIVCSDFNDTLDLSPRFFWKSAEEIENVQTTLKTAGLVFTADVSTTGPIFEAIELAFRDHCAANNIDYVAPALTATIPSPNTMSYVLLGPRGRANGRTWVEDPKSLTRFTFTLQALRSAPYSHTPNNLGDGRLVTGISLRRSTAYSAPLVVSQTMFFLTGALGGVFSTRSSRHSVEIQAPSAERDVHCSRLPNQSLNPLNYCMLCLFTCSYYSFLLSPVSVKASFIADVFSTMSDLSLSQHRSYLGPHAAVDLTLQHMPGSGPSTLTAWQNHLQAPREIDDHIVVVASTVDEGARALITLCFWLCSRPTTLKLKEAINEQFLSARPTIENAHLGEQGLFGLRARIGPGIGRGPRNEVIGQAVKILLSDGRFWIEREGFLTLRLHPSRSPFPYRFCVAKATGLILLLHFLFIGAPLPVSPFLFHTLFNGRVSASKFDIDFLSRFMSPDSILFIKRIVGVPLDQPLYSAQPPYCEVYHYLVNIPEIDPTLISLPRSEEEHQGISDFIVSYATLGTADIEHHPDYFGMGDGFNAVVEPFGGQDRPHHILEWFVTPCLELIKAAFDRQLKSPADILRFIDYNETNPEVNPWGDNVEMVALIERFVSHYLLEHGHPRDLDGVIRALIDPEFTAPDSVFRARLFLSVTTGSILLPVRPAGWRIKCLITHDYSEAYPTVDAAGNDDFGPDVVIDFRSCFKTFSITNNARLRHLLISENAEAGKDTTFGRLFHAQLLASQNAYTSS
ncbi:hypothetical protein R3P38DRAFT_3332081 [Favolaschia claudopus]|uniref:Uncharacterized protein n=1 Tax=Favolaschia claudopus TaxID=2862362 RepID=A0AAV9ZQ43_9AGAR